MYVREDSLVADEMPQPMALLLYLDQNYLSGLVKRKSGFRQLEPALRAAVARGAVAVPEAAAHRIESAARPDLPLLELLRELSRGLRWSICPTSTSTSSAPSLTSTQPTRSSRKHATRAAPLDKRAARLVKLGIALRAQVEGVVRSHARRALDEGESREEVRHVGLLALTTIGFPTRAPASGGSKRVIEAAK